MADKNEFEIILSLVDNASKELKRALAEARGETDKLKGSSDQAGQSLQGNLKAAGKEARNLKQMIQPIAISIAAITLATRSWADSNVATRDAFDRIGNSMRTLTSQIGSLFAPAIIELSNVIKASTTFLVDFFEKARKGYQATAEAITFTTQYWVAFFAALKAGESVSIASADALKIAGQAAEEIGQKFQSAFSEDRLNVNESLTSIKNFSEEMKNLEIAFVAGQIPAEEYYRRILEGQENAIVKNQILGEDLRNLAVLQAQLGNEESLRQRERIQEQIQQLQAYQQIHRIAHQGMATLTSQVALTMQNSLSGALTNVITGVQSAKEAFKQFGATMVQTIVQFIAQKIVASIIEKTLLAGTTTASTTAAAVIAAAWQPAATFVSLATFGANAIPAAAGIASVNALTAGIALAGQSTSRSISVSSEMSSGGNVLATSAEPRAFGGDDIVTRPTLFLAGERGPERATFQPLDGSGIQGRQGSGDVFITINGNVDSNNIKMLVEEIGFEIERAGRFARGI